jgi:hypothetical protein
MRKPSIILLAIGLAFATTSQAQSFGDIAKQMLGQQQSAASLADSDIAAGLKQALANGTRAAVTQLGQSDGFWGSDRFRIPLPGPLEKAGTFLQAAGYGPQMDELHLSMNRAAEKAVPIAADVFAEAVQKLTLTDARAILNGPPDAATQYFKRATRDTLTAKFLPIVSSVTAKAGLVQKYNGLLASAGPAASLFGEKADVNNYVARKALDALFARVGDEEKAIRTNPAARSTDLLKKVFGSGH